MDEQLTKQIQEQLQNITNSYGQIELDRVEGAKMLLRHADEHVIDYGYKGKRYYNPLNKEYQKVQFQRRVLKDLIQSYFDKKMEPEMWWMSKVPSSYYLKYGSWGDSLFTMKWYNKKEGKAESIKPTWA